MKVHISTAVWAFIDLLFNLLLVTLWQNQQMQPIKKVTSAIGQGVAAGQMCVQISWPDNRAVDIDLWGRTPPQPGEAKGDLVYYRSKSSSDMDLLRDDTGHNDPNEHHFETMCAHTLRDGEWTFNAVYFGNHEQGSGLDIPITASITFPQATAGDDARKPIHKQLVLHQEGNEATIFNFHTKDGVIVPGSINDLPVSLR